MIKIQLDEVNKKVGYNKEEFYEMQREFFSFRGLVENYKKELVNKDSFYRQ